MIELSIIVVNYNTADLTLACLQSIIKQSKDLSYELIVVDNASTDQSAVFIKSQIPEVIWLQNATNLGFGSAVNLGVSRACGTFVAVMNSDIVVLDKALEQMLIRFRTDAEHVGMVNCSLVDEFDVHQKAVYFYNASFKEVLSYNRILHILFHRWFKSTPSEIKALNGACLLFKRSLFESLKGFDPDFFLYSEEFDLCRRILAQGYTLSCYEKIKVLHQNEGSSPGKSWNLRQRSASIALLFRKTHGVGGLMLYYSLTLLNAVLNSLLIWRMNEKERVEFWGSIRIHGLNILLYFRILFRVKSNIPIKVK